MRITIRVGDALVDLENYNRVAVETFDDRQFLVGIRHSGRRLALFAVRPWTSTTPDQLADRVLVAITKALDAGKRVCVLSHELVDISDDPTASAALDAHNRALEDAREAIGRPYGPGDNPTTVRPTGAK